MTKETREPLPTSQARVAVTASGRSGRRVWPEREIVDRGIVGPAVGTTGVCAVAKVYRSEGVYRFEKSCGNVNAFASRGWSVIIRLEGNWQ